MDDDGTIYNIIQYNNQIAFNAKMYKEKRWRNNVRWATLMTEEINT